jgi:hypothetical protein
MTMRVYVIVPTNDRGKSVSRITVRTRGVGKNRAMNTASVSTLLDVLLPHRGPTREQDRRDPQGKKTGAADPAQSQ